MRLSQLLRPPCTTAIGFITYLNSSSLEQRSSLRRAILEHEIAVERNTRSRGTRDATYDTVNCSYFPHYQLATLPVTSGVHRQAIRDALITPGQGQTEATRAEGSAKEVDEKASQPLFCTPVEGVREFMLKSWQAAGERRVVVFGGTSTAYIQRLLETEAAHSYLVVDRSLKCLANMSAALVPHYGHRVWFLRCEALFTCLHILPPCCTDLVLVPMPMPVWSAKGSHRRLVTCDFWCAAHRVLRTRAGVDDTRGMLLFTDCERYAAFMMEQLAAAKLIVPWTRKNPLQTFAPWLPLSLCAACDNGGANRDDVVREFAKQRSKDVVAIAASKSGPTTPQAESLLTMYDFRRKYYRALDENGGGDDDGEQTFPLKPATSSTA